MVARVAAAPARLCRVGGALVAAVLTIGPAMGLVGCSGAASAPQLTPAAQATDAACVAALAKSPATVLGHARTPLSVAGAAAWGRPSITLRCGLPEQPPTTDPCLTIGTVDWVVNSTGDPIVFTTYGREPAIQVEVPAAYGQSNAPAALVDLAPVATSLPTTTHRCIGLGDVTSS